LVLNDEIEGDGLKVKGNRVGYVLGQSSLPPCLNPGLETLLSFEGTIDHRPLMHAPSSVLPPESNVHHRVECPERLPALGWTPDDCEACTGDDVLDQVTSLGRDPDLIEGNEADAGFVLRLTILSAVAVTTGLIATRRRWRSVRVTVGRALLGEKGRLVELGELFRGL